MARGALATADVVLQRIDRQRRLMELLLAYAARDAPLSPTRRRPSGSRVARLRRKIALRADASGAEHEAVRPG